MYEFKKRECTLGCRGKAEFTELPNPIFLLSGKNKMTQDPYLEWLSESHYQPCCTQLLPLIFVSTTWKSLGNGKTAVTGYYLHASYRISEKSVLFRTCSKSTLTTHSLKTKLTSYSLVLEHSLEEIMDWRIRETNRSENLSNLESLPVEGREETPEKPITPAAEHGLWDQHVLHRASGWKGSTAATGEATCHQHDGIPSRGCETATVGNLGWCRGMGHHWCNWLLPQAKVFMWLKVSHSVTLSSYLQIIQDFLGPLAPSAPSIVWVFVTSDLVEKRDLTLKPPTARVAGHSKTLADRWLRDRCAQWLLTQGEESSSYSLLFSYPKSSLWMWHCDTEAGKGISNDSHNPYTLEDCWPASGTMTASPLSRPTNHPINYFWVGTHTTTLIRAQRSHHESRLSPCITEI